MNHSNNTVQFMKELVSNYAHFDRQRQTYIIDLNQIPLFDLNKLSSMIMKDDGERACEATGPDNPAYETTMLPALLNHLDDITDLYKAQEFNHAWSMGVLAYNYREIETSLNDHLADFAVGRGKEPVWQIIPLDVSRHYNWMYAR